MSSSSSFISNNNNNRRRKTEACLKFQRGSCNYGHRCFFVHADANVIKPRVSDTTTELCLSSYLNPDFRPKMAVPWRTKMCHSWLSFGTCKYGSNCFFSHGESELLKRGSDNAEGVSCKWVDKTREKEVNGMRWEFKWDVDKISRVYGDWINDPPLVHVDTGNIPT